MTDNLLIMLGIWFIAQLVTYLLILILIQRHDREIESIFDFLFKENK